MERITPKRSKRTKPPLIIKYSKLGYHDLPFRPFAHKPKPEMLKPAAVKAVVLVKAAVGRGASWLWKRFKGYKPKFFEVKLIVGKAVIQFRFSWIMLALMALFAYNFWPHSSRILAAPQEASPSPSTLIKPIKPVKTLPQTKLTPVAEVAQVPVATPAPAAPTVTNSGCQTYWSGDYYLDNIIRFESGGNSCATNYLGCFGLLQACPGEPLRAACGGDPTCQIAWFQANKTGGRSWAQVWQHELDYGWW